MKFKCVGCGATYFHNTYMYEPPKECRFCGKEMVEDKMTDNEFYEMYINPGMEERGGEK